MVPSQVLGRSSAAAADILALEEVAALGWPAPDTRWLGRWLLRAADGWTGRANSVLPLGDPGLELEAALGLYRGLGFGVHHRYHYRLGSGSAKP